MKILTERDFLISEWSGGTTTQLFIFPEGASLADRNFDWRISSAVIETEESEFTLFEGYERILIPLKGKLEMEHQTPNGVLYQYIDEFELARFNGEWPTKGKGKLTDFNLIFKPSFNPKVHIIHFSEETGLTQEAVSDVLFLQAGSCSVGGELVQAPAVLLNHKPLKTEILCAAGSRVISIEINQG